MFPRDDVKLHAAVERLSVAGRPAAVFRPRVDAQAFKGVGGQAVWLRACCMKAPRRRCRRTSESLLGGLGTLRGWEFGARVGDRLLAASNRASPAAEFSPRDWQDGVSSLLTTRLRSGTPEPRATSG